MKCEVTYCKQAADRLFFEKWHSGPQLLCNKHAQSAVALILAHGTKSEVAACRIEPLP